MEISDVRRRVNNTIERARRAAAERRRRADEAARDYDNVLQNIAVPLFRQVANVLKVEGYVFNVFTPGGSVRLMSEKHADDYIELALDTTGNEPVVIGRSRRGRGSRVLESEQAVGQAPVGSLTEEDVLGFLLKELEPFVEK
jgi:hypothetical protein